VPKLSGGIKNDMNAFESSACTTRVPTGGVTWDTVGHIKYVVLDFHSAMNGIVGSGGASTVVVVVVVVVVMVVTVTGTTESI